MLTYQDLVKKFECVPEGTNIIIDDFEHTVITNKIGDCIFLQKVSDNSKFFHLFYDELDPLTDDFTLIGN